VADVGPQLLPHPGHRPGVPTIVQLEGVSRRYQVGQSEVYALRDVDLEVDEGEFAVVLGPSGSGKSTLLNIIGALDTPTAGRATVAGREITGLSRAQLFAFRRQVVSFIFQTFNLFPTLTALENVQCGAEIAGSAREARRRATEVLARWAWVTGSSTTPASCRAASSSASPSPGPSPPRTSSSWRTSRPATSTSAPACRSSSSSAGRRSRAGPSSW
jgi:hypothetical protein